MYPGRLGPEGKRDRRPRRFGCIEEGEEGADFSAKSSPVRSLTAVVLPRPFELQGGRPVRKSADVQGPLPLKAARPPGPARQFPVVLTQPTIRIDRCANIRFRIF